MRRMIFVALLLISPSLTLAQLQAQKPAAPATPNSPLYWSVDLIINNYVKALGANYKLSPEQEEYTKGLMAQRVKRFLMDNEKDVRWMAAEMMDYKMKGQLPPPEIAKEWAGRVKQMLPAIREEILDGNAKWREILNDDQKKMHDRDIDALNKQFDSWGQMMDRWAQGNIAPSDFDAPGMISKQPKGVRSSEDAWEFYVRAFIQMYSLDDSQQQSAQSLLREAKEQAAHYREAHKGELSELDAADKAGSSAAIKQDPEERKRVQEEARHRMEFRRELEKPISEMFTRLKARLEELPTIEQRQGRQQRLAKLEAIGKRGTTRPAITVLSSQPAVPASSQPATAPDASNP